MASWAARTCPLAVDPHTPGWPHGRSQPTGLRGEKVPKGGAFAKVRYASTRTKIRVTTKWSDVPFPEVSGSRSLHRCVLLNPWAEIWFSAI